MVKRDRKSIVFRNCLKKVIGDLKGFQPRRIDISFKRMADESIIRASHERCLRAIKAYIPIRIAHSGGYLTASFFIDNDIMGRLDSVKDLECLTGIPKDMIYSLRLSFVDGSIENDLWSIRSKPLEAIDASINLMYSPDALKELVDHPLTLPLSALCVSLEERMRYAYRTLLSFLTVSGQGRIDGMGLAMLHSSLEAGFMLGLPMAPKSVSSWIERFGLDAGFNKLVEDSYDFIMFENYLTSMFPELPLAERDLLQANYKGYMNDLKENRFDKTIPKRVLDALGIGRDDVRERKRRIDHLYR
ncbi:MAG: hypothetical protein JW825_04860 [Candidatus Methanofastidiosa archaeon]|nr:hypothetical protein [Candidatus Methanofastidiosa archaeon]